MCEDLGHPVGGGEKPHRPPTPPDIRFRIRRFIQTVPGRTGGDSCRSPESVPSSSTGKFEPPTSAASGIRPSPHWLVSALSSTFAGSPSFIGIADSAHVCMFNPSAAERPTMVSADFSIRIVATSQRRLAPGHEWRSPRVMRTLFHIYIRQIYDHEFRASFGLRRYVPPHPS